MKRRNFGKALKMNSKERKLNRDLIIAWAAIVVILFVAYLGEVLKHERTIGYACIFMVVTGLPALLCWLMYRRDPESRKLRYYIVSGYFVMYLFVMCSGSTILVFTYILPLLSFLILYHQPKLIAGVGTVTMLINVAFIIVRVLRHDVTVSNSKDVEIQIALLFLCFSGSYVASRLYDEIHTNNQNYVKLLDDKSEQLQQMTLQTIETIANTIDAKDEYTRGHSKRVSDYSALIAQKLGMSEDKVLNIRYVALLHDIGKIGVPDAVLNKMGRLTDEEYELMKQHTVIGGEILQDIVTLPDLDVGAKYHHERYDGKGYPDGLKGEEIPYTARIICIADAFDAMTSNRVYRKKLSLDYVKEEIRRCSGTQFDPKIAAVFLECLETGQVDIGLKEESNMMSSRNKFLKKLVENDDDSNESLDALTATYSRSAGEKKIEMALMLQNGCLILANIDDMQEINRNHGFKLGDYYLENVARLLKKIAPDIIVTRYGGDEFLCFVPNMVNPDEISAAMDRFMNDLKRFGQNDAVIEKLSVSVGITIKQEQGIIMQQLIRQTEKALYHVKQQMKGNYYLYHRMQMKNDEAAQVDLEAFARELEGGLSDRGAQLLSPVDCGKIKAFLEDRKKHKGKAYITMFTVKAKNDSAISIEKREEAMKTLGYAIKGILMDDDRVIDYSSVQRMVLSTEDREDEHSKVNEKILLAFYKMYDKKNVELYCNVKELG
jgi:diguanylate cyclase (GGDEF)-like protein